jgi:hypothetical protein
MHVQIVNFNLKDMTDAGFRSMANEVAPAFASVPGLLSKICSRTSARTLTVASISGRTRPLCTLTWPQTRLILTKHPATN